MRRGNVYYANLNPVFGSEQGGIRPVVIIQNDIGNKFSQTVIIAPMTSQIKHKIPTHVPVMDKMAEGTIILLEQIRAIDKDRLNDFCCYLSDETMQNVDEALRISLSLNKTKKGAKTLTELIKINTHDVIVKEYHGQRVVTLKDIDTVHERPEGTARVAFNSHKNKFVLGEDYFVCDTYEAKKLFGITAPNGTVLITEQGYLMLVKPFGDDLAWEVQKKLIKSYFNKKKQMSLEEMMRIQLGMIDGHEERITKLENTMNIDYEQQRILEKQVAKVVIEFLGGKESKAYKEISRKVFAECNHDVKDYFNVNSRNNIPRLKFGEAIEYIKNWKPCTNTQIAIKEYLEGRKIDSM